MAQATRSSILLRMQDLLGIQSGVNAIPVQTSPTIQPVVEIAPRHTDIFKRGTRNSSGTSTVYTTPTDKDFYLTYVLIAYAKDAACDNTEFPLFATVNGASVRVLQINSLTLTADQRSLVATLPYPLKIDKNTSITFTTTFTAGALTANACIGGFILE